MTRRGRKRRLVLEDEYWKLILDGVPTVEACRQIGIGRKTGYRWRAEAGGLPPARVAEETRSSRYLSLLERQRIATCASTGTVSARSPAESGGHRRRSRGSCAGISSRTTKVSTTLTSPMPVPGITLVENVLGPCGRSGVAGVGGRQARRHLESAADQCVAARGVSGSPGVAHLS